MPHKKQAKNWTFSAVPFDSKLEKFSDIYQRAKSGWKLEDQRGDLRFNLFAGLTFGSLLSLFVSVFLAMPVVAFFEYIGSIPADASQGYYFVIWGVLSVFFPTLYALWVYRKLSLLKGLKRTDAEQQFVDDPWASLVADARVVVDRFNARITRWNAIAKAIDRKVLTMTPQNEAEYMGLKENYSHVILLAHSAEFAYEWYHHGEIDHPAEDMQEVMQRLRHAHARIESFLEVDPEQGVQLESLQARVSEVPVSDVSVKRRAAQARVVSSAG